ncbi:MAG: helix-turn-helix domain-containing protein [Phycisphaerae bacterium]
MSKPNGKPSHRGAPSADAFKLLDQMSESFGKAWAAFASEFIHNAQAGAIERLPDERTEQLIRRYRGKSGHDIRPQAFADRDEADDGTDHVADPQRVSVRLKKLLMETGVSQMELARRMDVSPSVISRIINRPANTRVQTLNRIAHALGRPLSDLLGE